MFTNRLRAIKILSALAVLALLCLYSVYAPYWRCRSLGDCLAHPLECDNRMIVAGTARIADLEPDGFVLLSGHRRILIRGDYPQAASGKYANVLAVFHAPDQFEPVGVHFYLERAVKIWGSLAAGLIVCFLLLRALIRHRF